MRDVTLKIAPGGELETCSGPASGETFTVLDVPGDLTEADVIAQMTKVVIMPLRSQAVPWQAIAGKPQGAIINLAPKTGAERVKDHDARLEASGGRRLNGIRLRPEAAAALASLEAAGESATAIINRLLVESQSSEP